ncbi:MAG: hypothetical protein JSS82_13210 [Bacteroidetes bacterium]|nr:hypothetical protein [Bacteroidota bacterium]
MNRVKKTLYRKYNKLARGFHHNSLGGEFRHQRNTKGLKNLEGSQMSIGRTSEGYDYTPLFRFLLSRVGRNWDEVFSEAVQRLDKQEPIFWIVDLHFEQGDYGVVRIGESSHCSKLTVQNDLLVIADPEATAPAKSCTCCTHTFNGIAY